MQWSVLADKDLKMDFTYPFLRVFAEIEKIMANSATTAEKPVVSSWGHHLLETLRLGVPLVGAQLAQLAIHTTDIVIIGRIGTAELAAMVLAGQFWFTIFIFGSGFANAVVPMAAQAHGRGDAVYVRRAVRMGLWAVLGYCVLTLPIFLYAEPILVSLDQDPHVAFLAASYLHITCWSMVPALIFFVLRAFFSALNKAGIVLYVTIAILIANAFLAYSLVLGHFGFPRLGLTGAGIASVTVNVLSVALAILYIRVQPQLHSYTLFIRFWKPDWRALGEVLRLGLPISVTIMSEVTLFTVASLLMGSIGTIELAAHGIALQLASIAFMIPLGLGQAATVRVGVAHGQHDRANGFRAGVSVILLGMSCSIVGGTLFATYPHFLASLFLDMNNPDAAQVLAVAGPFVIVAGIFQLVDGLQAIASGLLRGIKDTTIPMVLALISYWAIGFVGCYVLAFPLHFGGIGIWYGFVLGLVAGALLLTVRFFRKV